MRPTAYHEIRFPVSQGAFMVTSILRRRDIMLRTFAVAALVSTAGLAHAQTEPFDLGQDNREIAQALGQAALESDLAYEITESLTTEVGPRLAGTPQEARARDWAVEMLEGLAFENVRVEPFELDLWTRGHSVYEEVAITTPYPQPTLCDLSGRRRRDA
jgi:hypothetical protein